MSFTIPSLPRIAYLRATILAAMSIAPSMARAQEPAAEEPPVAPAGEVSPPSSDAGSSSQQATPAPPQPESSAPHPAPIAEETPPISAPSDSRFVVRGFVGAGFSGYGARSNAEASWFSQAAASLSAGYFVLHKPGGSLTVSAEALVARGIARSEMARASGDVLAGGVVLSTLLGSVDIGLGGYVVSRASEARELGLTDDRLVPGVGAFLAKEWRLQEHWRLGFGVKVLMLPSSNRVEADGKKHLRFNDGMGMLGVSASFR